MIRNAKEELAHYDLLAAVMICLKPPTKEEDTEKGIIDLLSILLSSNIATEDKKIILEKDYGISMEKELKEVSSMCNYSDYVFSSGEKAMAELVKRLLADNRIEDAKLATCDEAARKQFYDEYSIFHR